MDYHFFLIVLVVFVILVVVSKLMDDKIFLMLGGIILLCLGLYVVLNGLPTVNPDVSVDDISSATIKAYGGAWYRIEEGENINFAVANQYYNITLNNTDHGYNTHYGLNSLIVEVTGDYQTSYMAVGSGLNNHRYQAAVAVNSIPYNRTRSSDKLTNAGDISTLVGLGLLHLQAGDEITIMVRDLGGTGVGIYYGGNMNIRLLRRHDD